jgi:hypothetical protein
MDWKLLSCALSTEACAASIPEFDDLASEEACSLATEVGVCDVRVCCRLLSGEAISNATYRDISGVCFDAL